MLHTTKHGESQAMPQDQLSGPRVPYNTGIELVLDASREYFNSSNDLSDSAMELARYLGWTDKQTQTDRHRQTQIDRQDTF